MHVFIGRTPPDESKRCGCFRRRKQKASASELDAGGTGVISIGVEIVGKSDEVGIGNRCS